ncbi:MAG TPA: Ig-like domain repeat protein, partial [Nitrospirota bacterium]|nr:Ig-like domain repeat protein [Nitrospirota bacterium]
TSSTVALTVGQAGTSTTLAANPNPSTYGNSVTFTANVISSTTGTPTGTVTFKDGTTTLGPGTLSGGTAIYATSTLGGGTHSSITAVYSGDTNFLTSTSPAIPQTVNPVPTTTLISAPTVTYNANGSVTVTVSSVVSTPTGSVSLSVDGGAATTLALSNGSASFTITSPNVGIHTLNASYAGQANFGTSSNTISTLTVNPAPTTTTINAPGVPFGSNGTVTVTVSSGLLIPTGNVSLTVDGGTPTLGTLTGNGTAGTATFIITNPANLTLGTHSLSASYLAQDNFAASSAVGQLSIGGAVTTTTITPPATITYGANGSVTVTVSSGVGTPTGSVSLSVDGTPLTPQGLVSGSATFSISHPSAGGSPHVLSASYSAQGNFAASSTTGTLIVNKAVLTVAANNSSKFYNTDNPTFTASYSGLVNGDTPAVLSGAPSLTTTATTSSVVGTYPITAAAGSLSASNYSISNFVNGTLTVTPALTTTSVTSSADPSYGTSVTFTAAVTSSAGMPTGMVTFMDGATALGTGTLSGGTTHITSTLSLGSHAITATYGGDSNFAASTTLSGINQEVMADGKIDGGTGAVVDADTLMALQISAGIVPQTASKLVHGDTAPLVNGIPNPDGKIDVDDVVAIARKAWNLPSW